MAMVPWLQMSEEAEGSGNLSNHSIHSIHLTEQEQQTSVAQAKTRAP